MPSATVRHLDGLRSSMGLAFPPSYRPDDVLIGTWSKQACGDEVTGMGASNFISTTYPAADRAIAFPFEIADYLLVRKLWYITGTTAGTDAADVGIYEEGGARLVSGGGGTTSSVANVVQEYDVTDTLLTPGRYWMAYVQHGTTMTPIASAIAVALSRAMGCAQMASAWPLPATFTPAAIASAVLPLCGLAARTQVA